MESNAAGAIEHRGGVDGEISRFRPVTDSAHPLQKKHMKIKIMGVINLIKKALIADKPNLIFVISSIVLWIVAYSLWVFVIPVKNIFLYTPLSYGPHIYVLVIFVLHLIVSIYSYDKDSKISHLLLGSVAFFNFMTVVLLLVYIINYG